MNNTTQEWKPPGHQGALSLSEATLKKRLDEQQDYLNGYEKRIGALIETCISNKIIPVFVTQPCLYGPGKDSINGVDLATARIEEGMNGQLLSEMLDLYNDRVKEVCLRNKVTVIDLARHMPKNSLYYYDQTHFTNEGAELVASIVAGGLKKTLDSFHVHEQRKL